MLARFPDETLYKDWAVFSNDLPRLTKKNNKQLSVAGAVSCALAYARVPARHTQRRPRNPFPVSSRAVRTRSATWRLGLAARPGSVRGCTARDGRTARRRARFQAANTACNRVSRRPRVSNAPLLWSGHRPHGSANLPRDGGNEQHKAALQPCTTRHRRDAQQAPSALRCLDDPRCLINRLVIRPLDMTLQGPFSLLRKLRNRVCTDF